MKNNQRVVLLGLVTLFMVTFPALRVLNPESGDPLPLRRMIPALPVSN